MQIPDKKIEDLQDIYRKNYGIDLSEDEARERGREILKIMKMVYQPMKESDYEALENRRKETQTIVNKIYGESEEKPWY